MGGTVPVVSGVWRISGDTGGTFTDCVAVAPDGSRRRVKVLSTGALRAGVIEAGRARVRLDTAYPDGLLAGWTLRHLSTGAGATITAHRADTLELDTNLSVTSGGRVELRTGEEAPIVGARLMTRTPLAEPLPPIEMRLATTRGTNALLERRGSPVCLFVTAGFADLLAIGDQTRPELFALNVVKPEPLPERVVEVPGRLAPDGSELTPLDLDKVADDARRALDAGITSAAVCLMHAWRNPDHERSLAEFLRGLGFAHVSVSHELASSIGCLHRAETAVVDAYLAEVLETYLESVREPLGGGTLHVMTSAGGLAEADEFRPKDGLLSGPAGGVVGARAAGAGLGALLAFDMGGTSTDASRIDDSLDYASAHTVGAVRVVAPALRIETVAAGGGSVCSIDRGEMRVGPESAGADPGPACYGAGGPLTITDANLLLGRLDPDRFGIPVDVEAARARAAEMLARAHAETNPETHLEQLLDGFVTIADERMADAVRAISVREGFDPADHTLVAFGGAGPQHACGVAERLGVSRILIPDDAGLLSAVGLAASPLERFAREQVLRRLDDVEDELPGLVRTLEDRACETLGHGATTEATVALRFAGQDFTIDVPFDADVRAHFLERYRDLFEHDPPDRPIEVESVRVRGWIEEGDESAERRRDEVRRMPECERGLDPGDPEDRAFFDGAWHDVRVVARADLKPGDPLVGPALVHEAHSTTVLCPGWRLVCRDDASLLLERESDAAKVVARDPGVERELFINRLSSVAVEMGERLRRTALSVNVKERADFSCAILDADGRLVVNAPHVPVHLGALGLCVRSVCAQMTLAPGDAVITNHPAHGGSHLPDVTVISPIHSQADVLLGYAAARAHHAEVGGTQPGSMPAGVRTLAEEGVVIPPTLIVRTGHVDRDALRAVFASGSHPSRRIDENLADAEAQLAACAYGARAVRALFDRTGEDKASAFIGALLDRAERRARDGLVRIGGLPRSGETTLDDASCLRVRIDQGDGGRVVFDFAGTSGVHPGNLNATPAIVTSAVLYVLRLVAAEGMPLNEGLTRAVELRIPECMLNPPFDADPARCPPVAGGNVETSQRLVNLLLRTLGLAAASQGTMNNVTFGNEHCSCYETLGGGCGAGPGFAGASAVHSHMTNTRITDAEVMEHRLPVIVRRFAVRRGSGGTGEYPGGDGIVREIEFTESVQINVLAEHRASGPEGMNGGGDGTPGSQRLVRADGSELAGPMPLSAAPGDRLVVETPGGGGWGEMH